MNSIFSKIKKEHFQELIAICGNHISISFESLYEEFLIHLKIHKKDTPDNGLGKLTQLENKWYDSQLVNPDYQVYSDPYYICDIWLCWVLYSRKSLLSIKSDTSLITQSVISAMSGVTRIIDLGCGFGYTTAGLKELFPSAEVYGTNLPESFQYSCATKLGIERNFLVAPDVSQIGKSDLLFASEYFEHFERPIEHLHDVIKTTKPKYLIVANGFNGKAIGHFNFYKHLNYRVPAKVMSQWFNTSMNHYGYKKLKTKIWNNRPSIWIKI